MSPLCARSEAPPAELPDPRAKEAAAEEISIAETIVVTATAHEASSFELPYPAESLSGDELRTRRLVRTLPEALGDSAGVMVQKTSHGQGSPYLRGFTGFRTLFLVDGIRLNNSVLREGPNQYWAMVDVFALDELETVRGPVSVLYGSEAIGGTVQALTRRPPAAEAAPQISGHALYRYASAERSSVGRLELAGRLGPRLGYALGGSLKDFGDVEAGGEVGRQPRTGYDEQGLDLKLRYTLTPATELTAAYQQVAIDDAWRTHSTLFARSWRGTTIGGDQRRALDQRRSLGYVQLRHDRPRPIFDSLTASLSFHRQEEEQDRVRGDGRRDLQGFDVATWGAWLRLEKATGIGLWTYGLESYRDGVDSFQLRFDAAGELAQRAVQGPVADDATYRLWGAYVQNQLPVGGRLRLILGARYTRAEADARAVQDPVTGERIAVAGDWDQVVGSARFLLPLDRRGRLHFYGALSQAFRAPNLSDLTRFDSARTDEIETPSPHLEPETYLAYELGVKLRTPRAALELAAFHTAIDDMVIRVPTGAVVDGELEVTKANGGDGYSRGLELAAEARASGRVAVFANVTWNDGEVDTFPTSTSAEVREPLDRLMPLTAHLGVRWQGRKGWIESLATQAAAQDRLSTRDRADTQRIPPGGTPGYRVLTVRGGWRFDHRWTLSAAVENLTDEDYRIHGSGLNEPGRNFVASVEARF